MARDIARDRLLRWRRDPAAMVREEFKLEPDRWQLQALRAFALDPNTHPQSQRIAMKACKGPGKTAVLAWMILNFLACYGDRGDHPKGAATSITGDNIDDNLWPEIAKWMGRSAFFSKAFVWTKTRVFAKSHPETWFFSKRTWPKSADQRAQAETLAGLHAGFLLFILDESGGIPEAVAVTAEAGLSTGRWVKMVQAGNPSILAGPLYLACTRDRSQWTVIEITGDPDDPNRSARIRLDWARDQIKKYGRNNPWVMVNVLGQFPPSSLNTLLGPDEVRAAMDRHLHANDYQWSQKRLGVDVARFGDDRTVLAPRQGLAAFEFVELRHQRTTDIAARVMSAREQWNPEVILVDDTGHWGHGVIDNLIAAGENAIGIQFHAPALDNRYRNRRTEMWLKMADWVKRGGCLPNMPELVEELTTPTYTFHGGQFELESKDYIKERLGRSPDLADALALTFAIPDAPASDQLLASVTGGAVGMTRHLQTDWDVFNKE